MSGAGFIAHALLGGTAESAKGIGNKIREEAKLKRQQALEQTRMENTMQEQSHAAALATGRDNLQREHDTSEAEKRRKHELSMSDKQHEQAKDLSDYDLKNRLELAKVKAEAGGQLTGWQTANLDRINSDIDNLQKMERDLMTGKTDALSINLGMEGGEEPQNREQKLQIIRQRLTAKELAFNRVLGNRKGVDTGLVILNEAANITDPAEQQEYLADLKGSKLYDEAMAKSLQEVWGTQPEPSQPAEPVQPATESQGTTTNAQGGMISEAQGQTQTPAPESQPAAEPEVAPQQQPPADASTMSPAQLQQKIIEKSRQEGKENYDQAAKQATTEVQNLMMYGTIEKMSKSDQSRREFFNKYGQYLRGMPEDVLNELRAVFGDDAINQYLQ